jgi:hypothetical protein
MKEGNFIHHIPMAEKQFDKFLEKILSEQTK